MPILGQKRSFRVKKGHFGSKMAILGSETVILRAHGDYCDVLGTNIGYCIMLRAMKSSWDQNIT